MQVAAQLRQGTSQHYGQHLRSRRDSQIVVTAAVWLIHFEDLRVQPVESAALNEELLGFTFCRQYRLPHPHPLARSPAACLPQQLAQQAFSGIGPTGSLHSWTSGSLAASAQDGPA